MALKLLPGKIQWKRWSFPSKASYISLWLGGFSLIIAIGSFVFTSLDKFEPANGNENDYTLGDTIRNQISNDTIIEEPTSSAELVKEDNLNNPKLRKGSKEESLPIENSESQNTQSESGNSPIISISGGTVGNIITGNENVTINQNIQLNDSSK